MHCHAVITSEKPSTDSPRSVVSSTSAETNERKQDRLRSFVNAYWLRPENAFWAALRSRMLSQVPSAHPSIDLGCGDGVFSFLHLGGRFDPTFDVFQSVMTPDRSINPTVDMFDYLSDDYQPEVIRRPDDAIDVGLDVKPALLAKAVRLNLYGRCVEHDNNTPLPFADDAFQYVYCNTAYWLTNIDGFLTELGRITRPGGRIILQVKLDAMRDYTLSAYRAKLGDRFLEIIGRGRIECWPTLANRTVWERRFDEAGLVIEQATPFITQTHARIWDIGLRPIAPLLVKMTQSLTSGTRESIKREWVDLFCDLLDPLCAPAFDLFANPGPPAEVQYVLTSSR